MEISFEFEEYPEDLVKELIRQHEHINKLENTLYVLQMRTLDKILTDDILKKFSYDMLISWIHDEYQSLLDLYAINDELLMSVLKERIALAND